MHINTKFNDANSNKKTESEEKLKKTFYIFQQKTN